ncbi:MAG TPA: DUF2807 domain-containing protein [Caulobacter sp.]|nr:DUF2807 domain-containing protein [Caulobacter sp.]
MRAILAFGVATAALLAAGAAAAKEPSVEIRDAVARVIVVPEARSDVKVSFKTTNADLPLTVRFEGDKTIVDGDLDHGFGRSRIRNCRSVGDQVSVDVTGVGSVSYDNMPQIIVQVPMDARVAAGGAVFGSVGRSKTLSLSSAGCGDWTVANVEGEMSINVAGSGDIRAGTAGSANLNVAGSGDIATAAVRGSLSANVAGSGDVRTGAVDGGLAVNTMGSGDADVASVNGDVAVNLAGSGDTVIRAGRAGKVAISIAGSGDVMFAGSAGTLDAKVAGSGDIRVASVSGEVHKRSVGSGDVRVGAFTIDSDD